jgi:hypothetical protein
VQSWQTQGTWQRNWPWTSKSIVEAHEWKIWAENNEKSRCTFHFLVPIEESLSFISLSRKSKILLIDKDSTFISSVKIKLEVVPGIDLPGISGFDLCQQIRQR